MPRTQIPVFELFVGVGALFDGAVNILNCLLYETFVWSLLLTGIKLTMKIYWLFLISHFSVIDVAFYDV